MNTPLREYSIAEEPLVGAPADDEPSSASSDELGELPTSYDRPLLVAVARDPRTLFVYWDVDWSAAFQDDEPQGRTVYLRVRANDDAEASIQPIEPLAGSCYVDVPDADTAYAVELGFYDTAGDWNSVIVSERVITPRDSMEQSAEFQLVTVPMHLSFQRLIDIFRGSKFDGQSISQAVGELQQRLEENGEQCEPIPPEHAQLIESLEWSLSPSEANQRAAFRAVAAQKPIGRARLERILGFGAASPTSASSLTDFGGGS